MPTNLQPDFATAELDPDILLTPYKIQTRWHVVTGAPCCGKTTMIDQLEDLGFSTVAEIAHEYIEAEIALGRTLDEVLQDRIELQKILIEKHIGIEQQLPVDEVTFLDRAIPDCLAFNRYVGLSPNDPLPDCFHHRYASVFILDPLPFQADGVRDQDAAVIEFLDEWLTRDYRALGYRVVRVPVLGIQERLDFMLESLSARGIIKGSSH